MRLHIERQAIPPPAPTFAERACQLVSFAVECGRDANASVQVRERELAEWIVRWQQAAPAPTQVLGTELGIILRAINGPGPGPRTDNVDCRELCWVLARCMAEHVT